MNKVAWTALALAVTTVPAMAATELRQCPPEVRLAAPGHVVDHASIPSFRWTAEPAGTTVREVAIFSIADPDAVTVGQANAFKARFRHGGVGAYGWFVTFKDAAGRALCRTPVGSFSVVRARAVVHFPEFGGAAAAAWGPVQPEVYMDADGRYVIVLRGSSYSGPRTTDVDSDDFDGRDYELGDAIGLVIHGNDNPNVVWGSSGHDIIWLYVEDDWAEGGPGDDVIVGGAGNDTLSDIAPDDTDHLYGGPGNDQLDTRDGDANDIADVGATFENGDAAIGNLGETRWKDDEPPPSP